MSLLNNIKKHQEVFELTNDLIKFITQKKFKDVNKPLTPRELNNEYENTFGIATEILKIVPVILYDHEDFQKYPKGFITNSAIYINANYMQTLYTAEIENKGTIEYTTAAIVQATYEFLTHNKINPSVQKLIKKRTNVQEFNQFFDAFISDYTLFSHFKSKPEFFLALKTIYNNIDIKDLNSYQRTTCNGISQVVLKYLNGSKSEIHPTEILNNYKKNNINQYNNLNIEKEAREDWSNNICNLYNNNNPHVNTVNANYMKTIIECAIVDVKNKSSMEEKNNIWKKLGTYIIKANDISDNLGVNVCNNLTDSLKSHKYLITPEHYSDYSTLICSIVHSIGQLENFNLSMKYNLIDTITDYSKLENLRNGKPTVRYGKKYIPS